MSNTFQINSGFVNISDPCYSEGTLCGKYRIPAKQGTWRAMVNLVRDSGRVQDLQVKLDSYYKIDHTKTMNFTFGVDSGQFGVFDSDIYEDTEYGEPGFYQDCCDITLSKSAGIVNGRGFVSCSGYGDGGYFGVMCFNEEGELVEFHIDFIEDEDDYDDYDEDEDEDDY